MQPLSLWRLGFVVAFVTANAHAKADHLVAMHKANAPVALTVAARDVFHEYFEVARGKCWVRVSDETDPACPPTWRRPSVERDVAKGEADLNDDGVPERFFVLEVGIDTCGSAGCEFKVLQRQGTEWRIILDDAAAVPLQAAHGGVDEYIRILDATDGGYHRICSGYLYVWNGTKYGEVFKSKKDAEDGNGVTCH